MQFLVKGAALWLDAPQPGGYFVRAPLGQRFLGAALDVPTAAGKTGTASMPSSDRRWSTARRLP